MEAAMEPVIIKAGVDVQIPKVEIKENNVKSYPNFNGLGYTFVISLRRWEKNYALERA